MPYFLSFIIAASVCAYSVLHWDLDVAIFFDVERDYYPLARRLTELGDSKYYLIPTGVIGLGLSLWRWRCGLSLGWQRVQYYALLVFTMVAVSGLCNNLLKILFGRTRPRQWFREEEYGFYGWRIASDYGSFPSGHSATLGALVAIAVLLGGRWGWLALPMACSIASTRVVVGSHYPSDVLMGLWVGFALAYALGYRLHRLYYERFTTA